MNYLFMIHRLLGGMILPALLLLAVLWFTGTWQPEKWPTRPARVLHGLVDLQVLLGLTFLSYLVVAAGAGSYYLSFPFLFHPLLGLTAAVVAKLAVRPTGPATRLGRWAPLASFGLLLVVVLVAGQLAAVL